MDLATASGIVKRRRDPVSEKYSRHGSFVRDFDLFDNAFFSVPEKEAGEIDPQQRVLIQVCAEALSNGGFAPHAWQSTNTAVYVGICNNDFDTLLRSQAVTLTLAGSPQDEISSQVNRIAYSTYAFAANRVSHTLALLGPSVSVDTASASSLVATHLATMEARKRGAGVRALSSGVNLILHPILTDMHTVRSPSASTHVRLSHCLEIRLF